MGKAGSGPLNVTSTGSTHSSDSGETSQRLRSGRSRSPPPSVMSGGASKRHHDQSALRCSICAGFPKMSSMPIGKKPTLTVYLPEEELQA